MANSRVSNLDIVDRVERVRLELKGDIKDLERKIDDIKEAQVTLTVKSLILGSIIMAIMFGVIDALSRKIIGGH